MEIDALVFDAYGTLFDVRSVLDATEQCWSGSGSRITETWRIKQLQYTWLRSLMDAYEDFRSVTRSALVFAIKGAGLSVEYALVDRLMSAYDHLDTFQEVHNTLKQLRGRKLAILSNGSPAMLAAAVKNAGLEGLLDEVISVDEARVYKPSPRAYALVPAKLNVPAHRTLFVSSNAFDVVGAKSFGFDVAWIRRNTGQMEELAIEPDYTVETLDTLIDWLE